LHEHKKAKGLFQFGERPFAITERLSRCGKRREVRVTSLLDQFSSQSR
jgi:hypothetical protein